VLNLVPFVQQVMEGQHPLTHDAYCHRHVDVFMGLPRLRRKRLSDPTVDVNFVAAACCD